MAIGLTAKHYLIDALYQRVQGTSTCGLAFGSPENNSEEDGTS